MNLLHRIATSLILIHISVVVAADVVDFQRDVRPVLADKCFQCHGPDEENREGKLRLDVVSTAQQSALAPGQPDDSDFIARITTDDPEIRMPPPDSGSNLSKAEVELLRRWIEQGADYQTHWAFVAPIRPPIPQVSNQSWVRNGIDAFVMRRLEREKLVPSPETDRITWLRRLSFDLIGLPPTIAEVDAFTEDRSPQAFNRQIDRLLNSPHLGERWARIWLDAARYADSNGYEKDAPREVWFYRDWVIEAFNRDMPYNEFVLHQIAGDLLPRPTQANLVATGFLRNSMINEEGGADPEQFRMAAMYDRMDAIGKSVLGLTMQCAQCHNHKYDPLTQDDYYRMFAFLNNTHDAIIPVYAPDEQKHRASILAEIASIEVGLKKSTPDWAQKMATWEAAEVASEIKWEVLEPVDLPYDGTKFRVLDDWSIVSESYAPVSAAPQFKARTKAEQITGFRIELLTHPQLPRTGPGRSVRGTAALSEFNVYVAPSNAPEQRTQVRLISATADVNPTQSAQPDYLRNVKASAGDKRVVGPIRFAIDGNTQTAWTTDIDPARRNQPRKAVFAPRSPVGFPQGTIITFQTNMNHGGWNNNDNHNCLMGRFRFSITTEPKPVADPLPAHVREILAIDTARRTPAQQEAVFRFWRTTVEAWSTANTRIEELWQQHPEGVSQFVLQERRQMRPTSLLSRGDFLKPVRTVEAGVPPFLHSLPDGAARSRLTFARWLVDERSPTTARSIVNRVWQACFGVGLVETSDDLGSQSSPPSHRELLDWLAVELMQNNWSLKHVQRLIVSSRDVSSVVARDRGTAPA